MWIWEHDFRAEWEQANGFMFSWENIIAVVIVDHVMPSAVAEADSFPGSCSLLEAKELKENLPITLEITGLYT